jgi:long-subunit fatty acid transport protein
MAAPTAGAFAGPARASAGLLYWNPAAGAELSGGDWALLADVMGNLIRIDYDRSGIDPNSGTPFPSTGFTSVSPDVNLALLGPTPIDGLRLIAGAFAPSLSGTRWDPKGPQRHGGTRAVFVTFNVSAGLLVNFGRNWGASIMAGPVYGYLTLENAVDFGAYANGLMPAGTDLFPVEDPLLEGVTTLHASGWTMLTLFGAWARPVPWLRLGAGLQVPRGLVLEGTVAVDASDALQRALPGFNLRSRGQLEILFPLPWQLSVEAEASIGRWGVAAMFQYIDKSIQNVVLAYVTEAEPDFIEGEQVSVKGVRDDWRVGLRLSRQLDDAWEVCLRFDVDPRYIPDETVNATNLDFTTLHSSAGALWKLSPTLSLTASYSWVYLVPYTVKSSLFNPRVPRDSGLGNPAANGRYSGWAHNLNVGVTWLWGGDAPAVE